MNVVLDRKFHPLSYTGVAYRHIVIRERWTCQEIFIIDSPVGPDNVRTEPQLSKGGTRLSRSTGPPVIKGERNV